MLNPFFLNGSKSEQTLIQSLVNEQIRMYGVEVYYMPRKYITKNTVIREVIESKFNNAYPLEAYVDSYEGYGGQGTILTKFGIDNQDDLDLVISRDRFENYITPLIKNLSNIELSTRPKEGDIIWFPLGERMFEIKFVEHEQPFYQLKKNYVYKLKCELFRYEDEVIDTGVDKIDDDIEQIGYIQTLNLLGLGQTAQGTVGICTGGSVQTITIENMGSGYKTNPTVGFSSAPSGGVTAVGFASITRDYNDCFGNPTGMIASICLTNAGCGYTLPPKITIQGGGGTGAAATSGITTFGSIQSVIISNAGAGYTMNPEIVFPLPAYSSEHPGFSQTSFTYDNNINTYDTDLPQGFVRAEGNGVINSAGIVTAVCITNAGAGYTNTNIDITFEDPSGIGTNLTGSFIFNEIVIGQTSLVQSRVKEYDAVNNTLEISIIDGQYLAGEEIVGQESGARRVISGVVVDDLVTPYADNDIIESKADEILNFDANNPFGTP
tara:strand:+ start:29928 stop:31406 length:1479 start_codon:yes stop_codon:yes gene_type:complete